MSAAASTDSESSRKAIPEEKSTEEPSRELTDTGQLKYVSDPDVQLMLRTRDGDNEAFAELFESYKDRLVGVFYHMFRDQAAAEDLSQEVFMRVYRAKATYRPTAKFSTWLYRIASNLASNSRRSRARSKEVSLNLRESGPMSERPVEHLLAEKSGMMPTRQLAKSELREVVRDAMQDLNERQRLAVLLNKFEGMSYADIAEAMDMKPAAVKSLLSRARENLREKLERYIHQAS